MTTVGCIFIMFFDSFKSQRNQVIEGALHNLYAEKEPIRSEAIKDTVDWVLARM